MSLEMTAAVIAAAYDLDPAAFRPLLLLADEQADEDGRVSFADVIAAFKAEHDGGRP